MGEVVDKSRLAEVLLRRTLDCGVVTDIEALAHGGRPYVVIDELRGFREASISERRNLAAHYAFGIIRLAGCIPVAYDTENDGEVVREVAPMAATLEQKSSQGAVRLPAHTDMAYLRFPGEENHVEPNAAPDFLVLVCVEDTAGVPTRLVTLGELAGALSNREVDALRAPGFSFRTPDSVAPPRVSTGLPLIWTHDEYGDMCRFTGGATTSEGYGVELDRFGAKVEELATAVIRWKPGRAVVFNNRTVLHGRAAISVDNPDGRRHLRRVYAQRLDTPRTYIKGPKKVLQG